MFRKKWLAVLAAVIFAACAGVAVASSALNPWSDTASNDVKVKQTAVVQVFINDGYGGKDYLLSFSRPIEIFPGYWCVVFSPRVHQSDQRDTPFENCWNEATMGATRLAYIAKYGVDLKYFNTHMGDPHPEKTVP